MHRERRSWRKIAVWTDHERAPLPLLLLVVLLLSACSQTRRVPPGEHLLTQVQMSSDAAAVSTEDLYSIVKQRPNKRVLGLPIYLYLYNWADPVKAARVKALSDSACAIRNAEKAERHEERTRARLAQGKAERPWNARECRKTRRVWWMEDVGEAPVLLDSASTQRSTQQIALYLNKEGYFNPSVTDSVSYDGGRKHRAGQDSLRSRSKARVHYRVKAGTPHTICTWRWRVNDPRIDSLMQANRSASLVKEGMRFDADVLDQERTRVTDMLRRHGYLFFSRDLVTFDADTAAGKHEVDLVMRLEQPIGRTDRGLKDSPEGRVFRIAEVSVNIAPATGRSLPTERGAQEYQGLLLSYPGKRPQYKPRALRSQVLFRNGSRFDQTTSDRTYRRLNNLRVFDRVEIVYDTAGAGANEAKVRIDLTPAKRQNFGTEFFGTNRGGFLGTSLNFSYRHKNLLRNMGSITAQMTFGFEAQQGLTGSNRPDDDATIDVRRVGLFNTLELGPEITLRFPRFMLPLPRSVMDPDKWSKSWNQRTTITALYNYQQRPDYTRSLAKIGFGYEWQKGRTRTWGLFPVDVNFIRIPLLSAAFRDFITTSNDAILRDSYTDHVIAGAKLVYTWNTQSGVRKRDMFFWRPIVQTSGHLLSLVDKAIGSTPVVDSTGAEYHTLAGVRFAQFVKMEHDFRWYRTLHERSSLVFRAAAGVGVPFGNLSVLPFEASFFGGGANGMRAWRPRTLGPGSYGAPLIAFDRIGEVRIEGNAEYRFKLVGYVEGALFADIGNIWMLEENPAKPGSGFRWDRFYSELAVGTGFGLRLNFDFFLVRFDLGLQTKDPAMEPGERWIFQPKERYGLARAGDDGVPASYRPRVNFNLGIGYPF